jgi:hypothetical protein
MIPKDANKIILSIYCDNCELAINYTNNNFNLDTSKDKQFILDSAAIGENIDNFYGNALYYSIKIKNYTLTPEQNYNFKIVSTDINIPIIASLFSVRNEHCKIKKDSPCYFIIPIEKHNVINKFRIYVPILNNEQINIYQKTMQYSNYDSLAEDELSIKIILDNYEKKIIDKFHTNYYEQFINRSDEDIDDDNFEKIYVFKIESNSSYAEEITIISSHYNLMNKKKTNLLLNDYSLIYLNDINKVISLMTCHNYNYNKGLGLYSVEINLIKGKGKIIFNDNTHENDDYLKKKYILDYET